jgi:triosephosphate isomerase
MKKFKTLVIGNWKMNPSSVKEAEKLFNTIAKSVSKIKKVEIIICPPFIYLEKLKKLSRKVSLCAQDAFIGDVGAFTGEISPEMLYNLGIRYVLLGHSERRALGENNNDVNKKLKAALSSSLVPILCIGESVRDEQHEYFNFIKNQIIECLKGIKKNSISKMIIAYEPIWSISSTPNRKNATSDDFREMVIFIRKTLSDISTPQIANNIRIIFGGSVTEKDTKDFLQNGKADGVLPGRASLSAEKFIKIVKIANESR